jgi:hypothetical protein
VSEESEEDEMDVPQPVSPAAWLAARKDLLAREKEVTHAKDAVDATRRDLPMTEVAKAYTLTGPDGRVSLGGLFGGRRQLITYHFMWRHAESGFPGVFGCAGMWLVLAHRRGFGPIRLPRPAGLHHALMAGAMIWMLTAIPGMTAMPAPRHDHGAMAAMPRAGVPGLRCWPSASSLPVTARPHPYRG